MRSFFAVRDRFVIAFQYRTARLRINQLFYDGSCLKRTCVLYYVLTFGIMTCQLCTGPITYINLNIKITFCIKFGDHIMSQLGWFFQNCQTTLGQSREWLNFTVAKLTWVSVGTQNNWHCVLILVYYLPRTKEIRHQGLRENGLDQCFFFNMQMQILELRWKQYSKFYLLRLNSFIDWWSIITFCLFGNEL